MVQNPVKIAILMTPTLGDALLYLVLANNLQKNDYQVTFFNTPFSHLQKWLPSVLLKPLPIGEDVRDVFLEYDLVISIPPIVDLYKNRIPADEFAKFCVFIYAGKNEFRYKVPIDHVDRLKKIINNEFLLPIFSTLDELAAFVYESALMIGNDSGVGHLASCLNIPTLIIMNTNPGSSMRWRPGWAYSELVYPAISLNVLNRRYWKCFLSVKKMFNAFNRFVENLQHRNLL